MLTSKLCVKNDFSEPWFIPWRESMKHDANGIQLGGRFLHRKEWEFVTVCQALEERGMLGPGKRGLGFAVGLEPLPSIFANRGCTITATDHETDSDGAWDGQWASDLGALNNPDICEPSIFHKNVTLRRIDMNNLPADLNGYDFSWSCCALEHLGSLQKGLEFLHSQMRCLRPGGVAVHTTEYNLLSNDATLTEGPTVVYRQRDLSELQYRLEKQGHSLEPMNMDIGNSMEDWFIAHQPWEDTTKNLSHLRLLIGRNICTSVLLIATKSRA
ncbi:class I SAM-dependent methyltransferase [Edaphobacter dinghuensis]|nr:class I SAM-dependent methyltransferase [Edaphobacter dinghuensis]